MNKEIKRLEFWIEHTPAKNPCKIITADEAFINFSERGIKPDFSVIDSPLRFRQLQEAKRQQGIQMQMWEDGILEGAGLGYRTILGGEEDEELLPREIVDFMKKEMFKGIDATIIEETYRDILKNKTWFGKIKERLSKLF